MIQGTFTKSEIFGVNTLEIQSYFGRGYIRLLNFSGTPWSYRSNVCNDPEARARIHSRPRFKLRGRFDSSRSRYSRAEYVCYFTIGHFALIFALVGVAALLGRRFTLRTAMLAMTILAVLFGAMVIL